MKCHDSSLIIEVFSFTTTFISYTLHWCRNKKNSLWVLFFCFSKFEDYLPDDSNEDANILEMVVCLMKVCKTLESNIYVFMNNCICFRTNKTISIIIDLYQQSFLFQNSRLILVFVRLYKFSPILYSFFCKSINVLFGLFEQL